MMKISKFHLRSFVITAKHPIESMWIDLVVATRGYGSLESEVQTTKRMKSAPGRSLAKLETSALISMLKDRPEVADKAMRCLYEDKGWAAQGMSKVMLKGGSREDAEEVVTDALLAFQQQVIQGKYLDKGKGLAYFLRIVSNLWISLLRARNAKKRIRLVTGQEDFSQANLISNHPNIQQRLENEEFSRAVRSILTTVNEDCRKLLAIKESRLKFGDVLDDFPNVTTVGSLKNKWTKCRNEIRMKIQAHLNLA